VVQALRMVMVVHSVHPALAEAAVHVAFGVGLDLNYHSAFDMGQEMTAGSAYGAAAFSNLALGGAFIAHF
jgi:hypothetical protein